MKKIKIAILIASTMVMTIPLAKKENSTNAFAESEEILDDEWAFKHMGDPDYEKVSICHGNTEKDEYGDYVSNKIYESNLNSWLTTRNPGFTFSKSYIKSGYTSDVTDAIPIEMDSSDFTDDEIMAGVRKAGKEKQTSYGGCGPIAIMGILDYFARYLGYEKIMENPYDSDCRIELAYKVMKNTSISVLSRINLLSGTFVWPSALSNGFNKTVKECGVTGITSEDDFSLNGGRKAELLNKIKENVDKGIPVTLAAGLRCGNGTFAEHYTNVYGYETWVGYKDSKKVEHVFLKARLNLSHDIDEVYVDSDILDCGQMGVITYDCPEFNAKRDFKPRNIVLEESKTCSITQNQSRWFKFTAPKDGIYVFDTEKYNDPCSFGDDFRPKLEAFNGFGLEISSDDMIASDSGSKDGHDSKLYIGLKKNNEVYIKMSSYNNTSGAGSYTLNVSDRKKEEYIKIKSNEIIKEFNKETIYNSAKKYINLKFESSGNKLIKYFDASVNLTIIDDKGDTVKSIKGTPGGVQVVGKFDTNLMYTFIFEIKSNYSTRNINNFRFFVIALDSYCDSVNKIPDLNKENSHYYDLNCSEGAIATFTPTKTGYYVFERECEYETEFNIYDNASLYCVNDREDKNESGVYSTKVYLEQGVEYLVLVNCIHCETYSGLVHLRAFKYTDPNVIIIDRNCHYYECIDTLNKDAQYKDYLLTFESSQQVTFQVFNCSKVKLELYNSDNELIGTSSRDSLSPYAYLSYYVEIKEVYRVRMLANTSTVLNAETRFAVTTYAKECDLYNIGNFKLGSNELQKGEDTWVRFFSATKTGTYTFNTSIYDNDGSSSIYLVNYSTPTNIPEMNYSASEKGDTSLTVFLTKGSSYYIVVGSARATRGCSNYLNISCEEKLADKNATIVSGHNEIFFSYPDCAVGYFTPQTSGIYTFDTSGTYTCGNKVLFRICDMNGNVVPYLSETIQSNKPITQYSLTSGKKYKIEAYVQPNQYLDNGYISIDVTFVSKINTNVEINVTEENSLQNIAVTGTPNFLTVQNGGCATYYYFSKTDSYTLFDSTNSSCQVHITMRGVNGQTVYFRSGSSPNGKDCFVAELSANTLYEVNVSCPNSTQSVNNPILIVYAE